MTYPTHDTDWDMSAKGNYWRRVGGKILVVGLNKLAARYWVMVDRQFAKGSYTRVREAQKAAEAFYREQTDKQWEGL